MGTSLMALSQMAEREVNCYLAALTRAAILARSLRRSVPSDTADLDDDGDVRELTPLDLDGNPRFADDLATQDTGCSVDMGAYEFPGVATSNPVYLGDLDSDG